jgi:hypothetical protein
MAALAGDHVQVLVAGYELTGDLNTLTVNDKKEMYDVSTFGDAVHKFLPGRRMSSLDHSGYMNSTAARSHPVLKGISISGVVSLVLGQNTAPVVGDPSYCLSVLQGKYATVPETGKFVPFSASFNSQGNLGGWGRALAVPVTFTNTTTGSGVDNGASSANGGAAFLHVLQAAASDTYTIIVEGATNAGFSAGLTTLATFTLNASALGSERVAISGTIQQYTRFKATRSGSAGNTVKIAVFLIRF